MLLSVLRSVSSTAASARKSSLIAGERGPEVSDEVLVGRALGGERLAASELFRRHSPYLLGMVVRMLRNRADGEDVLQETFAIALAQLATLREPSAFRGWAAQIAVSLVRKRIRRRRLLSALGLVQGSDDATLEALAAKSCDGETRAELALIDMVLASVDAEQRLAWMLRYVEGEELEAVAKLCGCSLATAKRRISVASARIAAHVTIEEDP
jgi:RNA polymerase sigma-70 factor (ECF subfamily)